MSKSDLIDSSPLDSPYESSDETSNEDSSNQDSSDQDSSLHESIDHTKTSLEFEDPKHSSESNDEVIVSRTDSAIPKEGSKDERQDI